MYQLHGTIELLRGRIGAERTEIDESEQGLVRVIQHTEQEPEYLCDLVDQYNEFAGKH